LLPGAWPAWKPGNVAGRPTAAGTIEQELGHDPSSGSQNELRLSAPLDTALPSLDRWVSLSSPSNGENRSEISVGAASKQQRADLQLVG
jgi:hypothetical protein